MTGDPGAPVFREEQRLIWPFWVLVAVPALVSWWIFIRQIGQRHTVGSNPAPDWMVWLIWIGAGFGLPVLFLTHRMVTEVWADSVSIRWRPGHTWIRRSAAWRRAEPSGCMASWARRGRWT